MARKRGFFAELQHQAKLAEQQKKRDQAKAQRAHATAVKQAAKARSDAERAQKAFERAQEQDKKNAEKAALASFRNQMIAEAEAETARYLNIYDEIDSLLTSSLSVDDYVDLKTLKVQAEHPEFDAGDAGKPLESLSLLEFPERPIWGPLPERSLMQKIFLNNSTWKRDIERIQEQRELQLLEWETQVNEVIPAENERRLEEHQQKERFRRVAFDSAKRRYESECRKREVATEKHNKKVDDLIRRLEAKEESGVNEYISIVLANSVYPDQFPVDHEFNFDSELNELDLTVTIPTPESVPTVKHVKFVMSTKELKETHLSKTEQKARYNEAVFAVALRTLHEVFEADRKAHIESISLCVKIDTLDPSTGHQISVPFVFAAAGREQFLALRLSHVEALAALEGLNASISKNPFGKVSAPSSAREVRG